MIPTQTDTGVSMILTEHIPLMAKILKLEHFLTDPVMSFGYQDVIWHQRVRPYVEKHHQQKADLSIFMKLRPEIAQHTSSDMYEIAVPWQFLEDNFNQVLRNYGSRDIATLDLFDQRSDIQHDMNLPISDEFKNRFNTVIDLGSTEHVFDTRQCLENLFGMLKVGGHIFFHLPCYGCFSHGFYTFSPETIIESLKLNGFDITFLAYSIEPEGLEMKKPVTWSDCILWCAARKTSHVDGFVIPQQKGCLEMYGLEVA
jgi:hypothetical protein